MPDHDAEAALRIGLAARVVAVLVQHAQEWTRLAVDEQEHALAEGQPVEAFQHAHHGLRRLQTPRIDYQMEFRALARCGHNSSSRQTMNGCPQTSGPSEYASASARAM